MLHSFATNLEKFAHHVEQLSQGNARAVQDLSRTVTELATTTATSIDGTHEQLGAVAIALEARLFLSGGPPLPQGGG